MALPEVGFDGDLWLLAERGSRTIRHIDLRPQVNVTGGSGSTWVSLTGSAVQVDDDATKKEPWDAGVATWSRPGRMPRSSS